MDPIQKETILEEKTIRIWLTKYVEEVLSKMELICANGPQERP